MPVIVTLTCCFLVALQGDLASVKSGKSGKSAKSATGSDKSKGKKDDDREEFVVGRYTVFCDVISFCLLKPPIALASRIDALFLLLSCVCYIGVPCRMCFVLFHLQRCGTTICLNLGLSKCVADMSVGRSTYK